MNKFDVAIAAGFFLSFHYPAAAWYGHQSSSDSLPHQLECIQRPGTNLFDCREFFQTEEEMRLSSPSGWRCVDTLKSKRTPSGKRPLLFCRNSVTGENNTVFGDFVK